MPVITVFPDASTELSIAALITTATVLAGAIIRIVLSLLAVSVARKALEDPPIGQADAACKDGNRRGRYDGPVS